MRTPERCFLLCAAVVIGCGGETNVSAGRDRIGDAGVGGNDAATTSGGRAGLPSLPPDTGAGLHAGTGGAGTGGAASGGRGGSLPNSPRDASAADAFDATSDG